MAAALGEGNPGSGHEVLHRPRHQDLRRPRERRDPVGDLHGGPGDVVADQVHLAGVDPGPDLDAEGGRVVEDGGRAADRLAGGVEGGQEAVRGGLDQAAAVVPDQVPGGLLARLRRPRSDRLRVQDRGQHSVGSPGGDAAGQEAGDLGAERVAVPAGGEPQRMVARLLEIAGARRCARPGSGRGRAA